MATVVLFFHPAMHPGTCPPRQRVGGGYISGTSTGAMAGMVAAEAAAPQPRPWPAVDTASPKSEA